MLRSISKTCLLLLLAAPLHADELLGMPDAPAMAAPSGEDMEKASGMKFIDWLQLGMPGYAELRQGAAMAGSTNWIAPRLADGRPVPQASARELAMELQESDKLPSSLKKDIQKAFPSETTQFEDHRSQNQAELDKLKPQIEAMEARMDMIEATMKKNVYDKGSFPAAAINYGVGYRVSSGQGLYLGTDATHYATIQAIVSGQLPDGAYSVTIGGHFDTPWVGNKTYVGVSGGNLTLGSWQLRYGEISNLNFSNLIYSGFASSASSLFHNSASYHQDIGLAPVGVGPPNEMWNFRRIGQPSWWWPFNDAQILFTPHNQFYETFNTSKLYDAAFRLDFSPLQAGSLAEIKPYVSGVYTYNEYNQMKAAGIAQPLTQNNRAAAAGFDLSLGNGSTLLFEGAASEWERGDLIEPLQDTAYYGLATLPLGDFTLVAQASQIGPHFITGGNKPRLSDNVQTGAYLDSMIDDIERQGSPGTFSYQTIVREPEEMTNNSRRVGLKAEGKGSFMTLGVSYNYSEQIQPSGPWLQSHFVVDGTGYNGNGMFNRFGGQVNLYTPLPYVQSPATGPGNPSYNNQWAFARSTEDNANAQGKPLITGDIGATGLSPGKTYWHELTQLLYNDTQTWILLSQNGVGDHTTRADSRKYLGALKAVLAMDFKPIFDRDLPADLVLDGEVRDVTESPEFPSATDEHLFSQAVGDLNLRWGLTPVVDFLGNLGYEDWESQQSLYPVRWVIRYGGLGFDFKLDEILSGMMLNLRTDRYEFYDTFFAERSYTAWGASIGTAISY